MNNTPHQQNNEIRKAIDACFPSLDERIFFERDVLRRVRGEMKVRKKLSVGFVLVVVLVLVTITAIAAMTLNELYEKTIQKSTEQGAITQWNTNDKVSMVQWMIEAEIPLNQEQINQLQNDALTDQQRNDLAMEIIGAYYPSRDGTLVAMDILAKEKGPYEFWSLEDKAWFTSTFEKYAPSEDWNKQARNLLPGENDLPLKEALQISRGYLTEVVGLSEQEIDETLTATYFFQVPALEIEPIWFINYYLTDGMELMYSVAVDNQGNICNMWRADRIPYEGWTLSDQFSEVAFESNSSFFSVEGFATFAQSDLAIEIREAIDAGMEELSIMATHFAQIPYAFPDATAISQEEANEIAKQAVLAYTGWSEEELCNCYKPSTSYRVYEEGAQWRVSFRIPWDTDNEAKAQYHAGEIPFCFIVQIEPFTGDVLNVWDEQKTKENVHGE